MKSLIYMNGGNKGLNLHKGKGDNKGLNLHMEREVIKDIICIKGDNKGLNLYEREVMKD